MMARKKVDINKWEKGYGCCLKPTNGALRDHTQSSMSIKKKEIIFLFMRENQGKSGKVREHFFPGKSVWKGFVKVGLEV